MYCPEKEANSLNVSGVKVLLSNTGSFESAILKKKKMMSVETMLSYS